MKKSFKAKLIRPPGAGMWTYMDIPFDVKRIFGTRSRLPVSGTINGHKFRTSIMAWRNKRHIMVVNLQMRKQFSLNPGDIVKVVMEQDTKPRIIVIPKDLKAALAKNRIAGGVFSQFPPSHRKEIVLWVNDAKQEETRKRRIARAVELFAKAPEYGKYRK